jgi:hypothetical protein
MNISKKGRPSRTVPRLLVPLCRCHFVYNPFHFSSAQNRNVECKRRCYYPNAGANRSRNSLIVELNVKRSSWITKITRMRTRTFATNNILSIFVNNNHLLIIWNNSFRFILLKLPQNHCDFYYRLVYLYDTFLTAFIPFVLKGKNKDKKNKIIFK